MANRFKNLSSDEITAAKTNGIKSEVFALRGVNNSLTVFFCSNAGVDIEFHVGLPSSVEAQKIPFDIIKVAQWVQIGQDFVAYKQFKDLGALDIFWKVETLPNTITDFTYINRQDYIGR